MLSRGVVFLLSVLILGCGRGPDVAAELRRAEEMAAESGRVAEAGRRERAGELMRRAYEIARAMQVPADPGIAAARLRLMAHACCRLGEESPVWLARAARYAEEALALDPGSPLPLLFLGSALRGLGFPDLAAAKLEEALRRLVGTPAEEIARRELALALLDRARVQLAQDRPGSAGRARLWIRRSQAVADVPGARDLLAELDARYLRELELAEAPFDKAIVHCEHGSVAAASAALDALGRADPALVRLTRAQMVEEQRGTREGLQRAEEMYREMIEGGENLSAAILGRARVLFALDRKLEAFLLLDRLPEQTVEMRRLYLVILIDRLQTMPLDEKEQARHLLEILCRVVEGALVPSDRADLLAYGALAAFRHGRAEELGRLARSLAAQAPDDVRLLLVQARIAQLQDQPVHPGEGR